MGRGNLSEEEMQILKQSPYVREVRVNCVIYTDEFKLHFMKEYMAGKGPQRIFREVGFDVKILGSKRIERAAARWKEAYAANSLIKPPARGNSRGQNFRGGVKLISQKGEGLEQEIEQLKKQISMLCKNIDCSGEPIEHSNDNSPIK